MQLKAFRGNSMAAALCAVKKELGKDAVIVHTRTFKVGGVMGVGGKEVVEVLAATEAAGQATASKTSATTRTRTPGTAEASALSASAPVSPIVSAPRSIVRESGRHREAAPQVMRVRKRLSASPSDERVTQATSLSLPGMQQQLGKPPIQAVAPGSLSGADSSAAMHRLASLAIDGPNNTSESPDDGALSQELGAIKAMLAELLNSRSPTLPHDEPVPLNFESTPLARRLGAGFTIERPLTRCFEQLIAQHVSQELAGRIIDTARRELSNQELDDTRLVREVVLRHMSHLLPTSDTSVSPIRSDALRANGKPFTIALVGPTGVGKTTTIAKLAAAYKLKQGLRVGLITSDTYRVGAVEQLSAYAGMIGVPLKVAATASEMVKACDALDDSDVVLIDTAGRSPRDGARLSELNDLLQEASPDETHLVLASTAAEPAMLEAARSFARLGTSRVIFTKLDEAVTFGVILNVAQRIDTQLSFVTTGQEVPSHIEATRADRLARLMLASDPV